MNDPLYSLLSLKWHIRTGISISYLSIPEIEVSVIYPTVFLFFCLSRSLLFSFFFVVLVTFIKDFFRVILPNQFFVQITVSFPCCLLYKSFLSLLSLFYSTTSVILRITSSVTKALVMVVTISNIFSDVPLFFEPLLICYYFLILLFSWKSLLLSFPIIFINFLIHFVFVCLFVCLYFIIINFFVFVMFLLFRLYSHAKLLKLVNRFIATAWNFIKKQTLAHTFFL